MRKPLKQVLCLALAVQLSLGGAMVANAQDSAQNNLPPTPKTAINLIPTTPNDSIKTPNYVCTWSYQDWWINANNNNHTFSGNTRDVISHNVLFGEDGKSGWINSLLPEVRGDLIYLLDDGWDLPRNGDWGRYYGSFVLSDDKFPNYGNSSEEKLKTLVDNIEGAGWKGVGIWICCDEAGGFFEGDKNNENDVRAYWAERLEWCKYAGIDYWKIDWGGRGHDMEWRKMISKLADEIYPELVIEHCIPNAPPMNDYENTERITHDMPRAAEIASFSDVYRTYDVTGNLSVSTTFDRIGEQLVYSYTDGEQLGLMNAEDEVYMCSALGLMFGVMRYPIGDNPAGSLPNIFFGGGDNKFTQTRPIRKMHDEVKRATFWQRIAPTYRIDYYKTEISKEFLRDTWDYSNDDTWYSNNLVGKPNIGQKAPAVIARGFKVADVGVQPANGQAKPFVGVSRHPNGAISIGTFGRTTPSNGYQPAKANITLKAGDLTGLIGIFGYYNSLELEFNQPLTGKKVYAQDMMAKTGEEITDRVAIDGNKITIPGELIQTIGLNAATDDASEPGMVLKIGENFEDAPGQDQVEKPSLPYNPSFELSTETPLLWGTWYQEDNMKGFIQLIDNKDAAQDGSIYMKHSSDKPYRGGIYQSIGLENGVYNASVWVKASAHSGAGQFVAKNYGGPQKIIDIGKLVKEGAVQGENGNWTKITIEDILVTNGTLQLDIFSDTGAGDYILYDHFELTPGDALSASKKAAQAAVEKISASNNTTKDEILSAAQQAIVASGITAQWKDGAGFKIIEATDSTLGKITGTIELVDKNNTKTEFDVNLTIAKAPVLDGVIANPSFDEKDSLTAWSVWSNTTGGADNSKVKTDGGHTGNNYVIHQNPSSTSEISTYQTVKNLANGLYDLSVWVKSSKFSQSANPAPAVLAAKKYGGSEMYEHISALANQQNGINDWTEVVLKNIPVSNGEMQIEVYSKTAPNEYIMFDDFDIRQGSLITAKQTAKATVNALQVNNQSTADMIINAVKGAVDNEVIVNWKENDGFKKVDSTLNATGSITGTVVLTMGKVSTELYINMVIPIDGYRALQQLITVAATKKQADYTAESWVAFDAALIEAKAITAAATPADITLAYNKLNDAMVKLEAKQPEQPSKEALLALIASAKEMAKDSKYTQASRDVLAKAIDDAQVVANNKDATQPQIEAAQKALQDAIDILLEEHPEQPNKDTLLALIASAKELAKDSKYTQASRDALTKAIATAQAVAGNDKATQQEIADAQKVLQNAINALVQEHPEQPSKEGLLKLLQSAKEMAKDSKYNQKSRDALTKAIATAQAVADNDQATVQQIADIQKALQDAIDALVQEHPEQPSKEGLLKLLQSAKEMAKDSKYTQKSRDALTKAIATAQAVADNATATKQEIADAQKTLQNAIKALVKQGGESSPAPKPRKHIEPNMVSSSALSEKVASSSKGADISVRSDYKVATGFLNDLVKNKEKSVTLNGDWYSWTFNGKNIENTMPGVIWFDTRITTDSPNADAIAKLTNKADTTNLHFNYEGKLPGETVIRAQLEKYAGKPVYIYYHNPEKGRLELIQADVKADKQGWIEFTVTAGADYVISPTAIKGAVTVAKPAPVADKPQ